MRVIDLTAARMQGEKGAKRQKVVFFGVPYILCGEARKYVLARRSISCQVFLSTSGRQLPKTLVARVPPSLYP